MGILNILLIAGRRRRGYVGMIGAMMIIFSSVMVASHIAQGADSDVRAISAVRSIFEHTKI